MYPRFFFFKLRTLQIKFQGVLLQSMVTMVTACLHRDRVSEEQLATTVSRHLYQDLVTAPR